MSRALDTNVALYWLGGKLLDPPKDERLIISVVTEMEVLSWPFADAEEETAARSFLKTFEIIQLTDAVKEKAIEARRERKLKLPDAIIAATALVLEVELLTNDDRLHRVTGLQCSRVPLKPNDPDEGPGSTS